MLFSPLSLAIHLAGALLLAEPSLSDPIISQDGSCGGSSGYTCTGSTFGICCSSFGFCGSDFDFCATSAGCQPSAGECYFSKVTVDGTCGSRNGSTCSGSTFGTCCSSSGWCGDTAQFCGEGCEAGYGSCDTINIPSNTGACGAKNGNFTCSGGVFNGACCSGSGFCGSGSLYCGGGCQEGYGSCNSNA